MLPCPTCRSGCCCIATDPGCGHFGCLGSGPTDCTGVLAEQDRWNALLAARRREHDRRRMLRVRSAARLTAMVYGQPFRVVE